MNTNRRNRGEPRHGDARQFCADRTVHAPGDPGRLPFRLLVLRPGQQDSAEGLRGAFHGSVSGLATGGSVLFNGLKVGEVKELGLIRDDPSRVYRHLGLTRSRRSRPTPRPRWNCRPDRRRLGGDGGRQRDAPAPAGERSARMPRPRNSRPASRWRKRSAVKADAFIDRANKLIDENSAAI